MMPDLYRGYELLEDEAGTHIYHQSEDVFLVADRPTATATIDRWLDAK